MSGPLELVKAHQQADRARLSLVASENQLAAAARMPYLTAAVQRYAFPAAPGLSENAAWPGRQNLVRLEQHAAARLGAQLGAKRVNVKPISGVSALTITLSALARPGDTVWHLAEDDGGHGSTWFIGTRLGLVMRQLPCDPARFALDLDRLAELLDGQPPPTMVYLDPFLGLFPTDLAGLRAVVGPDTLIHVDASHPLGLIAGGEYQDPLCEGADTLGGSTHKTYPGPHKGVLATNRADLADMLDEHASHFVSHHHPADVAALAVAADLMDRRGARYAAATIANAQHLAESMAERGLAVCAASRGYTACHQVWIDMSAVMPAEQAAALLLEAGLVVNAIPIPYLPEPGLRLGVQEASWLGLERDAMEQIAEVFAAVLRDRRDPATAGKTVRALLDAIDPDPDQTAAAAAARTLLEEAT